jgi:hypothetical protein
MLMVMNLPKMANAKGRQPLASWPKRSGLSQCLSQSLGQRQNARRKWLFINQLRRAFPNQAERARFELAVQVYPVHRFSKPAHSTTLPPLRY